MRPDHKIIWIALMIAWYFLLNPASAKAEDFSGKIALANEHYQNNRFEEARQVYETLVGQGVENGYLYYNLGNTYFRLQKLGSAIHFYVKARTLLPRDENLNANLNYAIQETVDQLEMQPPSGFTSNLLWVNTLSKNRILWNFLWANLAFWTMLAVWFYTRRNLWKQVCQVLFLILTLTLLMGGLKIYNEYSVQWGVVLDRTVDIKSASSPDSVTLFQLHEGAIVQVIDRQGSWIKLRLDAEKQGWTESRFIGT